MAVHVAVDVADPDIAMIVLTVLSALGYDTEDPAKTTATDATVVVCDAARQANYAAHRTVILTDSLSVDEPAHINQIQILNPPTARMLREALIQLTDEQTDPRADG